MIALVSLKNTTLTQLFPSTSNDYEVPLFEASVSAGFPSPAQNEMEKKCDLNSLLIKHPAATFFVRASGTSMIGAGIHDNDILIVDRSVQPTNGKIVIAAINGELTVKRLVIENNKIFLVAENKKFPPFQITDGVDLHIWGVVINVIHYL